MKVTAKNVALGLHAALAKPDESQIQEMLGYFDELSPKEMAYVAFVVIADIDIRIEKKASGEVDPNSVNPNPGVIGNPIIKTPASISMKALCDLRKALVDHLFKLEDEDALKIVKEMGTKSSSPHVMLMSIQILGRSEKDFKVLRNAMYEGNMLVAIASAKGLGDSKHKDAVDELFKRTQAKGGCPSALYRVCVESAVQHKSVKLIPKLIDALRNSTNAGQQAILSGALTKLSGVSYKSNASLWTEWYEKNKGELKDPETLFDPETVDTEEGDKGSAVKKFFGKDVEINNPVFILDISGSMLAEIVYKEKKTTRLEALKLELASAIEQLDEKSHFGIVLFNHTMASFNMKMIQATPDNKKAAYNYINSMLATGGTNISVGLQTAYAIGSIEAAFKAVNAGSKKDQDVILADSFILLSDGAPGFGLLQPDEFKSYVEMKSGLFQPRIDVFTVGAGLGSNPIFKALTTQTGGKIFEVE